MNLVVDYPVAYCISDGSSSGEDPEDRRESIVERVRFASSCGISMYQVREKGLDAKTIIQITEQAVAAASGTALKVLVNERTDIALAAFAAGVHLPSDGAPVEAVRAIVPADFIIGVSTHSLEEIVSARSSGADFVVFGPVFPTPGKQSHTGLGVLRKVCLSVEPFPVIALGGIDARNYQSVLDAGAFGYASLRYLNAMIDERIRTTRSGRH